MADEAQARSAPDPAAIPDLLATAILVVDARSEVAWLNQAAAALLATSPGAARGRPLATLIADADVIDAPARAQPREPRAASAARRTARARRARGCALPGGRDADAARGRDAGRRAGRNRRHHPALAHDARRGPARAAGRQPRDGAPARARDQEPARRAARRSATAGARAADRGAARVHARDHRRGGPALRAGGRPARARRGRCGARARTCTS